MKRKRCPRRLSCLLYACIALLALGTILNVSTTVMTLCKMIGFTKIGETEELYIILLVLQNIFDVVIIIVFIRFAVSIIQRGDFFSSKQVMRLTAIGGALLASTLSGLFWPTMDYVTYSYLLEGMEEVGPELDLRELSFSFIFFVLAGIFEYGRILQEDSDDIL